MKTTTIAFSAASVLLISLIIIGTSKTSIVSALTAATTDATSTVSDTTTASSTPASASSATSTTDASSTSTTSLTQTQVPAQTQTQAQPSSGKPTLKLVHVVGTKYVDYFTDGKKTYSFPGNSDIDANLNKPNSPIPYHSGLKWVSTSGMEAYDTASGNLKSGTYAQEADGSFISNIPSYTYTDATSSVPIAAHIAASKIDPTVAAPVTSGDITSGTTTTAQ